MWEAFPSWKTSLQIGCNDRHLTHELTVGHAADSKSVSLALKVPWGLQTSPRGYLLAPTTLSRKLTGLSKVHSQTWMSDFPAVPESHLPHTPWSPTWHHSSLLARARYQEDMLDFPLSLSAIYDPLLDFIYSTSKNDLRSIHLCFLSWPRDWSKPSYFHDCTRPTASWWVFSVPNPLSPSQREQMNGNGLQARMFSHLKGFAL